MDIYLMQHGLAVPAEIDVDRPLTAEGREVSRTGRSGIYDITVTNAEGKRVAEFRGHSRTIGGAIISPDKSHA